MSETKLFDLEKIREILEPIEILQKKINEVDELDLKMEMLHNLLKKLSNYEEISENVKGIILSIENIKNFFKVAFKNNLIIFISLQDKLFEKYKAQLKDSIQKSEFNAKTIKKLGLNLIDKKNISRIPKNFSFLKHIGIKEWIELLDVLKEVTIFQKIIKRLIEYNKKIITQRLNKELEKVPPEVDNKLILKFTDFFLKNPHIKFAEFLKDIEDQEKRSDLIIRESLIKQRKEKEKLEELKKKQEERKDEYQDYLSLSEKEFERKIRKKKRGKLSELVKNEKIEGQLKISDEISEKIEKFKSQFDENFKEKFLTNEESDQDPIDLIRERNKKKKDEYAKYKDHFDNV